MKIYQHPCHRAYTPKHLTIKFKIRELGEKRPPPKRRSIPRPRSSVPASRIDIPIWASSRKDRSIKTLLHFRNLLIFGWFLDFHYRCTMIDNWLKETFCDEIHLDFAGEKGWVVRWKGVWAEAGIWLIHGFFGIEWNLQDGEVGEVMHMSTKISLSTALSVPLFVECDSRPPDDFHGRQEILDLESSRKDDYVKLLPLARRAGNAGFINRLYSLRYKFQILWVERFEIVGVENATLAACSQSINRASNDAIWNVPKGNLGTMKSWYLVGVVS